MEMMKRSLWLLVMVIVVLSKAERENAVERELERQRIAVARELSDAMREGTAGIRLSSRWLIATRPMAIYSPLA